ncbi:MAG: class IV adenylate cyclase [Pirellulales bacterium]|nr:class IV adenylate cyclase [Pirellulales bacterium]
MRNIELKARLTDIAAAREIARSLATKELGLQEQVDTYFHCHEGRLKLRQVNDRGAQLVWYSRPDQPGARPSDYHLVPVINPETLKVALRAALGVRAVVRKRREVFLWSTVRIHLDQIDGLGNFLEFEAVLGPKTDDKDGLAQLEELCQQFHLTEANLLPGSYVDMLEASSDSSAT